METDTIGGLKDHLLRTEQAMEAGVTECKQLNRALGDELRDLVDGPNGVKKNFQDLIDAFRRRLEEKTEELYADQITLESALHSKIRESNAEMGSRIDREVSSKCGLTQPPTRATAWPNAVSDVWAQAAGNGRAAEACGGGEEHCPADAQQPPDAVRDARARA